MQKLRIVQKYIYLEYFQAENTLLTRKWQPPQSGVDFGENDVFPQNDALKHGVFQKQNTLVQFETVIIELSSSN
ncbi:MAG: hypothetical protein RR317_03350 [Bilophila sp.]